MGQRRIHNNYNVILEFSTGRNYTAHRNHTIRRIIAGTTTFEEVLVSNVNVGDVVVALGGNIAHLTPASAPSYATTALLTVSKKWMLSAVSDVGDGIWDFYRYPDEDEVVLSLLVDPNSYILDEILPAFNIPAFTLYGSRHQGMRVIKRNDPQRQMATGGDVANAFVTNGLETLVPERLENIELYDPDTPGAIGDLIYDYVYDAFVLADARYTYFTPPPEPEPTDPPPEA